MRPRRTLELLIILFCMISASGCASPAQAWKVVWGTSVKSVEDSRASALVKVLGYDYGTCYVKTEMLLGRIPKVTIYAKNEDMIAVYYNSINVNPVGVFFREVDATHTQVEVSSPSPDAKAYIAKNIFSGAVQDETEKPVIEVPQPVGGKYQ